MVGLFRIANYHITICTKDFENYFGNIQNGEMKLSPEREIAKRIWKMIPEKFPNIKLDEFIIMPNHIHGLMEFGAFKAKDFKSLKRKIQRKKIFLQFLKIQCTNIHYPR